MDRRERHLGGITTRLAPDGSKVEVDVGALVSRLILFEHCTLESDHLKEIPSLVAAFGVKGVRALLESGAVSIICDYLGAGNVGQTRDLKVTAARGGILPLSSYRIMTISVPERLEDGSYYRSEYVHQALKSVNESRGLTEREIRRLQIILRRVVTEYPRSLVADSGTSFKELIAQDDESILKSLKVAFSDMFGRAFPDGVTLKCEDLGNDGDFRVVTNLASYAAIDENESHKVIERALLGAANVDQRLLVMEALESVSGFKDSEIPVFEGRFARLWSQLDPIAQENRFKRITTIGGLPLLDNLAPAQQIDMTKLLKFRDSEECRELRRWLRRVDSEPDAEIEALFESVKERLARVTHTRVGKTVRFIIDNGAGAVPVIGPALGPAVSILDKYLMDKVIGEPGPVSFLGHSYPSIFIEGRSEDDI